MQFLIRIQRLRDIQLTSTSTPQIIPAFSNRPAETLCWRKLAEETLHGNKQRRHAAWALRLF